MSKVQVVPPQPDARRALDLVMRMMRIKGESCNEKRIVDDIRKRLLRAGCAEDWITTDNAHLKSPFGGEIGNLVLKLPGTRRGPRRLFMAHVDTVPICVGAEPVLNNGTVTSANAATGLGADDRAGAAVVLTAALEILRQDLPHPPLTFLWCVQEEIGLQGIRYAKKGLWARPKLAFNFDGGSPYKLTIGATGGYRMQVTVQGRASHAGGAPEEGVSAIAIASIAVADLHVNGWHGNISKQGKRGTSNVGVIQGGNATNVVTDSAVLRVEARSHDPEFRKQIVQEIEKSFRNAARQVRSVAGHEGRVEFDGHLDYESFQLNPAEPCVHLAREAVSTLGRDADLAICNGGLDANWMTAHGIPTVTMGCGQRNQHTVDEALVVDEYQDAARIALQLACG